MNYGCTNNGNIIKLSDSRLKYSLLKINPIKVNSNSWKLAEPTNGKLYEEVCIFNEKEHAYVYFKASKLLILHGIEFMITIFNREEKTVKVKLFLSNTEDDKLKVKGFNLANLPFEVKREYFISANEDSNTIYKNIWHRIDHEYKNTQKRLNGMNIF